MPLGIKRNELDIDILETNNELSLVIVDSSTYIEPPDRPLLEVYLPGYSKYLLVTFIPNQVNTFNSNTLGLSRALSINHITILPDGVWKFRYKICPYDYVYVDKIIIRTTDIEKKLDQAYNSLDLSNHCTDKTTTYILDQLTRVRILLRAAKAVVEKNEKVATDYYRLADRLLNQVLNTFCKNCNRWGVLPAEERL